MHIPCGERLFTWDECLCGVDSVKYVGYTKLTVFPLSFEVTLQAAIIHFHIRKRENFRVHLGWTGHLSKSQQEGLHLGWVHIFPSRYKSSSPLFPKSILLSGLKMMPSNADEKFALLLSASVFQPVTGIVHWTTSLPLAGDFRTIFVSF